jgi:hypothetical protein
MDVEGGLFESEGRIQAQGQGSFRGSAGGTRAIFDAAEERDRFTEGGLTGQFGGKVESTSADREGKWATVDSEGDAAGRTSVEVVSARNSRWDLASEAREQGAGI